MTTDHTTDHTAPLRIDIVSDVVCPWCALGYAQLTRALEQTGIAAEIHFHPFELNPTMPPQGQDLREHLAEKYGASPADSAEVRNRLETMGAEVGVTFRSAPDSRIVNTFRAHQLIAWADQQGREGEMKQALLHAYHSEGRDIHDLATLKEIAEAAGFDAAAAENVLESGLLADEVRAMEQFWVDKGIRSVPSMVFDRRNLVSGARGVDEYASLLARFSSVGVA